MQPDELEMVGQSEDRVFRYVVDFPKLMLDIERFTNAFFGDEIFEPMLAGIHQDEEGPRIDVRRVVKTFSDRLILVVRPGDVDDHVMFVIPLATDKEMLAAIDKAMAIEPDVTETQHNGVTLHLISRDAVEHANCVVDRCFVVGDAAMVRDAIDRYQTGKPFMPNGKNKK